MHIISGYKKNKKIITPKRDFRPTQGKVREALFNIIDANNKTFLDLCAGSGAVGFEALSRGANFAAFIEIDREAVKTIFTNAKNIFEENQYKIKRVSADDYVKRTNDAFDIIFFDPPYHSKIYYEVFLNIFERKLLNDDGYLFVEMGLEYYKSFLEKVKEYNKEYNYEIKTYGESVLIIFRNI